MTIVEALRRLAAIETPADGAALIMEYANDLPGTFAEQFARADRELGYLTGDLRPEERERVYACTALEHPVSGRRVHAPSIEILIIEGAQWAARGGKVPFDMGELNAARREIGYGV